MLLGSLIAELGRRLEKTSCIHYLFQRAEILRLYSYDKIY